MRVPKETKKSMRTPKKFQPPPTAPWGEHSHSSITCRHVPTSLEQDFQRTEMCSKMLFGGGSQKRSESQTGALTKWTPARPSGRGVATIADSAEPVCLFIPFSVQVVVSDALHFKLPELRTNSEAR